MPRSFSFQRFCGAVLLLLAAGCSTPTKQATLLPVGPPPPNSGTPASQGCLVVYSAWSNFVDQGSTGHHSRYVVSSDDGSWTREIINHVDRFDEGPIQLSLRPGAYHVRARSAHFGRLNVPVVIQPRQTTYVFLDGSAHSGSPGAQQATAVRLPDGEVVGWSATVQASNSH